MAAADFVGRWGALAGPVRLLLLLQRAAPPPLPPHSARAQPREATVVVRASKAVDLEAARALLASLKIATVDVPPPAGAPPMQTLHGACTFRTNSVGRSGDRISVGTLVRVDANAAAGAYRVIVRSQHPDVTAAAMKVIAPQLGVPAA
jgi:hypothetical protein